MFPKFPRVYKQGAPRPIEGYISFVAQHNGVGPVVGRELYSSFPSQADQHIGQACLELAAGKVITADRRLRSVQGVMKEVVRDTTRSSGVGRLAMRSLTTARMIEHRHNEGAVGPLRREMHTETVKNMRRIRSALLDDTLNLDPLYRKTLSGELVEQAGLSIITRYAHPRAMVLPALHFQDQGPARRRNFDMVLVETREDGEGPSQKIQTKSDCIDLCGKNKPIKDVRAPYNSDITFLSGCCDLDMRGSTKNPDRYTVPDMLIKEVAGRATPREITILDELTDRALFNLTIDDERRMGKLPLEEVAPV